MRTWAPHDDNPRGRVFPAAPSAKRQRPFAALEKRLWLALYSVGYGAMLFWMLNGFTFA